MDAVFSRMQIRMQYRKRIRSALISEILGFLWRNETAEVRKCYETLADLERILYFRRHSCQNRLPKDVLLTLATWDVSQSFKDDSCATFKDEKDVTTLALMNSFEAFSSKNGL
jgi:hypothetical protein